MDDWKTILSFWECPFSGAMLGRVSLVMVYQPLWSLNIPLISRISWWAKALGKFTLKTVRTFWKIPAVNKPSIPPALVGVLWYLYSNWGLEFDGTYYQPFLVSVLYRYYCIIPQRIHVWYIYLHLPYKSAKCRQTIHGSYRYCIYIYFL